MNKEDFMYEAIRLSQEGMNLNLGGPFGAIVVKNGKIVGKGVNKVTSNNDCTAHAEITAIRDACKNLNDFNLSDCEIYTSCEPCPMCLGAIYRSRIKKIYFANTKKDAKEINFDDSYIYQEFAKPPEKRNLISEQLMNGEAKKVFEERKNKQDKVQY